MLTIQKRDPITVAKLNRALKHGIVRCDRTFVSRKRTLNTHHGIKMFPESYASPLKPSDFWFLLCFLKKCKTKTPDPKKAIRATKFKSHLNKKHKELKDIDKINIGIYYAVFN